MEKEFEDYWNKNQKRLILNAPRDLRDEYIESTKLSSPLDWLCFVLPIAVGVVLQANLRIKSEFLSWGIAVVVIIVCFAALQMVKPHFQSKRSTSQVVESIKQHYYELYLKNGLKSIEPWS